jgi:hypothetical protein
MRLGLFSYNVEHGARPDELAHAAQVRGFDPIQAVFERPAPALDKPGPAG